MPHVKTESTAHRKSKLKPMAQEENPYQSSHGTSGEAKESPSKDKAEASKRKKAEEEALWT